ncbi:MAG: Minf_1886 family protein [Planctomycetota bacterium]|nr:Minf_1886 family protein [Planctomycetota bacterium]MEC8512416.1 Minf_1886 family protein [Planctomycetota bacterium]
MDPLQNVAKADGRYRLQAYQFLFDALDTTVELTGKQDTSGAEKHVSGKELLEGMRVHATRLFGPLAAQVWRSWGVHETADWGRIVFNLVDHEMLRRQDTDSIEDFDDGYDFDEVFVASYTPALPAELDAAPRPPIGLGGTPAPDGDAGS